MTDYKSNKAYRLLNMYERMSKGEHLQKRALCSQFGVTAKTVQRDLDELRAYFSEVHQEERDTCIVYDKKNDSYSLKRLEREWLTREQCLSLCKILLESRAFTKAETGALLERLMMQIAPADRKVTKEMILSEYAHFVPLRHNRSLFDILWKLSECIVGQRVITLHYCRQDGKKRRKELWPVAIMFSEFYFYLIAFDRASDHEFPAVFRVDRIDDLQVTNDTFDIPYRDRFSDGEFRKRVQFMYSGRLKRVTFRYSGVLEAMLDRLPTAKVLRQEAGEYIICAESYGNGIDMWLAAQGEKAQIIEQIYY